MINLFSNDLEEFSQDPLLINWLTTLPAQLHDFMTNEEHGDFKKWLKYLERIAKYQSEHLNLSSYIEIGKEQEITDGQKKELTNALMQYAPWRKGPYKIYGIDLESEWRSDKKWDRLINVIKPLKDRYILDIGCGNGYHLWRMLNEGAKQVCGIDLCSTYFFQFQAIKHLIKEIHHIHHFPISLQQMPNLPIFDTVFSMGVIYHQRSPIEHLEKIRKLLKPNGQLVLETLYISGDEHTVLTPLDRYAKMANVWFIPSIPTLTLWLKKLGFKEIEVHNVAKTDHNEQRATNWSCTESLDDFLDPKDPNLTIEGYEAPQRVIITATN